MAGLLSVARAELFHQQPATTATTTAIAPAAMRSPLVRRSGLTMRGLSRSSSRLQASRHHCAGGADGGGGRSTRPRRMRPVSRR